MTPPLTKESLRLARYWGDNAAVSEMNDGNELTPDMQQDVSLARRVDPLASAAFETIKMTDFQSQQIDHKLHELSHKRRRKLSLRDPGVWAISFACFLLVAYGAWYFWQQRQGFEGMDEAARIVSAGLTDVHEFEPVEVPLTDLDDWFVLQGVNGLWIPSEFAKDVSIGARVLHLNGTTIACIAVPADQFLIYVFPGKPLEIHVQPEKRWKFFDVGASSAAIIQNGDTCFLVASRGSKADLEKRIRGRSRK